MKDYVKINWEGSFPPMKEYLSRLIPEMMKKDKRLTRDQVKKKLSETYHWHKSLDCWVNDKYQVEVDWFAETRTHAGKVVSPSDEIGLVHLTFKSTARDENGHTLKIDLNYPEIQHMKSCCVGDEYEAVSIFPAKSREVDTCNQYHLWFIVEKESRKPVRIPIGWE